MPQKFTVYFDGGCPVCRKEIDFYRGWRGAEAFDWIDLSEFSSGEVVVGLTQEEAMRRFHIKTAAGEILSGGRAFAALWTALPATQLLGRVMSLPGIVDVLELVYLGFLKIRPLWRPHICNAESCKTH